MKARMPSEYAMSGVSTGRKVVSRHSMAPPAVKPHETRIGKMALPGGLPSHTKTSSSSIADGDDRAGKC